VLQKRVDGVQRAAWHTAVQIHVAVLEPDGRRVRLRLCEINIREVSLFYMLGRSSIEIDVEDAAGISSRIQYSDTELSERIGIILSREFHVSSLSELTSDQIIRLIKIIRKRFYPGKSQIGRLLGIKTDFLDRLF
ncbi:MAG: hypothetical protein IIU05_03755, partial [Bacteroidales bacterium]|nr:hypothetical protein [Bacteroidales bacterium]